jgi:hypothetical protein
MTVYVRKPGSGVIHIRLPDRDETRCTNGRYTTTTWEIVVPQDRDWQDLCRVCAGRPKPGAKPALSGGMSERCKLENALREIEDHSPYKETLLVRPVPDDDDM